MRLFVILGIDPYAITMLLFDLSMRTCQLGVILDAWPRLKSHYINTHNIVTQVSARPLV